MRFFFFQVSMRATPASTPRTACLVRSGSQAVRAGPTGSTPGRAGSGPPTSWSVRTSAWSVRDSARTTRNHTSCSIQSNAPVSGSNFLYQQELNYMTFLTKEFNHFPMWMAGEINSIAAQLTNNGAIIVFEY